MKPICSLWAEVLALQCASESPGGLVKTHSRPPTPRVSDPGGLDGGREVAFLTTARQCRCCRSRNHPVRIIYQLLTSLFLGEQLIPPRGRGAGPGNVDNGRKHGLWSWSDEVSSIPATCVTLTPYCLHFPHLYNGHTHPHHASWQRVFPFPLQRKEFY